MRKSRNGFLAPCFSRSQRQLGQVTISFSREWFLQAQRRECLLHAAPFLPLPLAAEGDKAQMDSDILVTLGAAVEAGGPSPRIVLEDPIILPGLSCEKEAIASHVFNPEFWGL